MLSDPTRTGATLNTAHAGAQESTSSNHALRKVRLDGVYAALIRVPLFKNVRLESVQLEPLGSLTNASYKVTTNNEAYVLRLPGKDTLDYIDRRAEEHNSQITAAAGVNAEVIYCDARDGTMLSRFVEGAAMSEERFTNDPGAPARAGRMLGRVHRLGRIFKSRFNVFSMIDGYLGILSKLGTPLPEDYHEVQEAAEAVRRALEASPTPLVPCHNDPWPGNFLDAGGRLYLIDWEFSGMNDPMWDLGDLSVEAGLDPEQDRTMLEAYHDDAAVPPALYSRLALYKAMSDLSWSLWGFIQHANGNPRDDFWSYALGRFERCKMRMGDSDFGSHLSIVHANNGSCAPRTHTRTGPRHEPSARNARSLRGGMHPAGSLISPDSAPSQSASA